MAEYKKVKWHNKGNTNPKTPKQLVAHRRSGIKAAISGRLDKHQFKKGETPWIAGKKHSQKAKQKMKQKRALHPSPFKGKHHKPETKIKHGIRMAGRKRAGELVNNQTKFLILNPPMRNPENAKKNGLARRKNLPKELVMSLVERYNNGETMLNLAKEVNTDRTVLKRIFLENGVIIDTKERLKKYAMTNPNIIKNQIKREVLI